ncbi:hypothetical protein SAMN05421737_10573 [Shouchella lonarensis]|uniref:Prophage pi2 protein 38 n=2 Tax=Shouchella lonarensis TaxID=1464122 RepID=A0A1G6IIB9_9BACI|nr:hypothetical protein SAMN05421737_10573 [Shouchella lonarensis]
MLVELANILRGTGYPVAYLQFKSTPSIPFIVYYTEGSNHFYADNSVRKRTYDVTVELYTDTKKLAAEEKLENTLLAHGLPFSDVEVFIEKENLYLKKYQIGVI